MLIVLTLLLIFISVTAHEYGHLRAMQMHGIKVEKMAVGVPIPFLTIKIQHPKFLQGVPVYLSPILLLGFVKPVDNKKLLRLPSHKQLDVDAGGIVMNIIFSSFAYAILARSLIYFAGFMALGIGVFLGGKIITRYILPLCSLVLIVLVPYALIISIKALPDAGHSSSVAMAKVFSSISTFREALSLSAIVSLLMAVMNLLPLVPFDGGRMVMVYLKKWCSTAVVGWYTIFSTFFALVIILIGLWDSISAFARIIWKFVVH